MIKLKKLLKELPTMQVKGSRDTEITGISANSKLVSPGNLFVAKRGQSYDGNEYVSEAMAAGAVAILTDIYDPSLKGIVQVIGPNVQEAESLLAATYYGFPAQKLYTVGITGTNGKTTTAFLVRHLLESSGISCGLIGSIEYIIGRQRYQASHTTPDVVTNHRLLRELIRQECEAAVMEVTSHALDQKRCAGIDFNAAIFTNLTQDHLDYHGTMENYLATKKKLFAGLEEDVYAIVNLDDPWTEKILEGCSAKVLTFGIEGEADVRASDIVLSSEDMRMIVTAQGKSIPFHVPYIGRFNVYNILAAISVAVSRGMALEGIAEALTVAPPVSGRLEKISNHLGIHVYVDYAHTPDALTYVLNSLQQIKQGRTITVFGCGGDRDQDKRQKMGQAVAEQSDYAIITTDNPRSEDPQSICEDICKGFSDPKKYCVEVNRRTAISHALEIARPHDTILIAGKGHETTQVFNGQMREFDDRKVASELCEQGVKK